MRSRILKIAVAVLLPASLPAQQAGTSPVKLYLMVGQSNMVGHGNWYNAKDDLTLRADLTDPTKPYPLTQTDVDTYDAPRSDVWVVHQGSNYPKSNGALAPGFGENLHHIGVEMAMGHILGDALDNQFLFFKYDVGGTTLGFNWRPPSAVAARGGEVGPLYTKSLRAFHLMLRDIAGGSHYPDYNGQGYEIAGLVWLQGWNEYFNDDFIAEYRQNLVDFVQDMRSDIGVPDLPAVICDCPRDPSNAAHEEIAAAKVAAVADLNAERPGSAVYVDSLGLGPLEGVGSFFHWHYLAQYHIEMGKRIGAAAQTVMRDSPPDHDGDPMIRAAGEYHIDASARILHYRLNEGAGITAANSGTAPDADGTLTADTTWTGAGMAPGSSNCIDTSADYCAAANADPPEIGNNHFTNSCWVRLASGLPNVAAYYTAMSTGADKGFNFGVKRRQVGGQWKNVVFYDLRYRAEMEALNDSQGRPDLVLKEDKPYFIAFVRNMGSDSGAKDNTMLYLYDPETGSMTANDGNHYMVQKAWPHDNVLIGVGRDNSNLLDLSTRFPGRVDDVQTWDYSMGEAELLQLATEGRLFTPGPLRVTGSGMRADGVTFFIDFAGTPNTGHRVARSTDLAGFPNTVPLLPSGNGVTGHTGFGSAEFDVSGLPAPQFFRVEE